jgi:cell division protein FtsB
MKSRSYMQGPGLSVGMRAAVVLAILIGAYLIFEFGRIQANYNIVDAVVEQEAYESEIGGLEDQITELKQQIALLETHREIDREAYQVVETNLTDLQRKIQEQQDAIAFYRGIVSPKDGGRGLRVQDLKLTRGKDERHYNLRLVLVQVMQHDRSVKGEVDFNLEGEQDGVATTYTLQQLLPADSDSSWPFSFRYFQDFDRELILPDGFMPEKINIEVVSRTKSIASLKQSFDWLAGQS